MVKLFKKPHKIYFLLSYFFFGGDFHKNNLKSVKVFARFFVLSRHRRLRRFYSGDIRKQSIFLFSIRRHCVFMLKHLTLKKVLNILICLFEMKLRRTNLISTPFYLRVEVSPLCNLKCTGCILGESEHTEGNPEHRKLGMMSFPLFKQSLNDFLPFLVKVNLYDEGEPLLNKEICSMISFLSQHNIGTCVSSNFSLQLSDAFLIKLIDSGLEHLIIAVDGITQESYSRYRVGGDLNLVIENLRRLSSMLFCVKKKPPLKIELQYIDFDNNLTERSEVEKLALELGVWRFTVMQGCSRKGCWAGRRFNGNERARRKRGCYQLWVSATINSIGELGACDYGEDHGFASLGAAKNYRIERQRNHHFALKLRSSFKLYKASPLDKTCCHCCLYEK